MNAFEQKLTTALRDEAGEIAMTTDMNDGRVALDEKLDRVDRRRRRWHWGAFAAVVAVTASIVAFLVLAPPTTTSAPPVLTPPSPSVSGIPFHVETSTLTPNIVVDLPYWAALASSGGQGVGYANYDQADCGATACPADKERKIKMLSVAQMYRLQDGPTITQNPTFAVDLAAWEAVPSLGYGTVTDRSTTTVGGRPAVLLTVSAMKEMPGLASCQTPYDAAVDCFYPEKDRTYRIAFVDQGMGKPPTLLWESMNTGSPDEAAVLAEFDDWLATVRFD